MDVARCNDQSRAFPSNIGGLETGTLIHMGGNKSGLRPRKMHEREERLLLECGRTKTDCYIHSACPHTTHLVQIYSVDKSSFLHTKAMNASSLPTSSPSPGILIPTTVSVSGPHNKLTCDIQKENNA